MSVSVSDLHDHYETDLPTATLQRILDAADEEVVRSAGNASSQTETLLAQGSKFLALRRRVSSIDSITERRRSSSDPVTLSSNDYRLVGATRVLRLTDGDNGAICWGDQVEIVYTPDVDATLRDRVTLDLCKLAIEFRAFDREKTPDWEAEQKDYEARRAALLRQISEGRSPFA